MNHIKNENGLTVISEGENGSPIRMKCKYPSSLAREIQSYQAQKASGINPIITFEGDFEDRNYFTHAVKFYAEQK